MFWRNKKNHLKKSQTYLPTNNQFIAKVTFKGYVRYISILFSVSKNSLFKTKNKMCFIIFQRLFSFLRYSNLRILESKASRSPQMLKYKTRNAFNWIIWVGNTSGNNIWPVYMILQEKNFHQNIQQKCWTSNTQSSTYLYLNKEP